MLTHINKFAFIFFIGLLTSSLFSFAQNDWPPAEVADEDREKAFFETYTGSARSYISIAEKLSKGVTVLQTDWTDFFRTPPYDMMINGGVIDTIALKKIMLSVYSLKNYKEDTTSMYLYHSRYKSYLPEIKKYLDDVEKDTFKLKINNKVRPYLPERLKSAVSQLKFYYIVYGAEEATGMDGLVINDALLTYHADTFSAGLISAHECIHAIVSKSFQDKLKSGIDYASKEFLLFYSLQTIIEEGIADLIDKKLLSAKNSPLRDKLASLTKDDERLGKFYINRIDSLLTSLANNGSPALNKFSNAVEINAFIGKNGGHIPGRYMVAIIKDQGMLQELINHIDDPYQLLVVYQKATTGRLGYPQLSNIGINYFKILKTRFTNE